MRRRLELMEIVTVPEDYIRCSVCGKWHPIQAYNNDGGNYQSRTNCKSCYEMPFEDMKVLKAKTENLYKTSEYKNLSEKFSKDELVRNNCITKEELIARAKDALKQLEELPDDVLFTEYSYNDYDGTSFDKPEFTKYFSKTDGDYPYGYPTEIDGKKIWYKNNY